MNQPLAVAAGIGAVVAVVVLGAIGAQVRIHRRERAEKRLLNTLPVEQVFLNWLRSLWALHAYLDDEQNRTIVLSYGDMLMSVQCLEQFHQWVPSKHRRVLLGLFKSREGYEFDPTTYALLLGPES